MASLLNKIIKSLAACLLPLLFVGSLKAATLEPLTVRNFDCGLITTQDPTLIGDGCSQQLWNVDVWKGKIEKRRGSLLQNSTDLGNFSNQAVKFLHEFPDQNGNFWLISFSSNTLFASSNGGATNNIITSSAGLTSSSDFSAANAFGKAYLTDGTTNWIVFSGTDFTISTAPPRGRLAVFMFGRLFTADVSGTRSTLYASRINDPNDWTNDALDSGDSFQEFIRQNDGYFIRALIPFKNSLLIFKDYSIDSLTMGNDGLTPIVTPISNNVGTQHRHSIVQTDNAVIFMGPDRFYEFTGPALNPISDGINDTFNSILQKNSASRAFTESTKADFQAGTAAGFSTTISPNDLVLSTAQVLDNSTTTFSSGTLNSSLSTSAVAGSLVFSGAFEDFVDGNYTANPTWLQYNVAPTITNNRASWTSGGSNGFLVSTIAVVPGEVIIFDNESHGDDIVTGRIILSTYPITTVGAEITRTINNPGVTFGNSVVADIGGNDSIVLQIGATAAFDFNTSTYQNRIALSIYTSSVTMKRYGGSQTSVTATLGPVFHYITIGNSAGTPSNSDPISFGNIFIATGQVLSDGDFATYIPQTATFTSRGYPLSVKGVWYGTATFNYTLNGATATTGIYGSTTGVIDITNPGTFVSSQTLFNSFANLSTASFSISGSSSVFYATSFLRSSTVAAYGLVYPVLNNAQVDLRYSTGTYLGQVITLSNISSFGPFSVNSTLNNGSLVYALYTDTDSNIVLNNPATWISSQTITNNDTPILATATIARVTINGSITTFAQNPIFNDYTLTWNQGSANFPVWATFFEHEYHIAVSTFNTSNNDTVLIFDRNRAWIDYLGFSPYVLAVYRQGIFYGDATRGRIYKYNINDVYNDNGVAINTRWKSKEFDFGYPLTDKTMVKYSTTAKYKLGSDIVFSYGVNRGAQTSATLNLGSITGAFRQIIVPSSLTYQRGQTHSFSISDTDVDQPFSFLSVTLYPRLETDPQ